VFIKYRHPEEDTPEHWQRLLRCLTRFNANSLQERAEYFISRMRDYEAAGAPHGNHFVGLVKWLDEQGDEVLPIPKDEAHPDMSFRINP
jgi:hypothetical protein